MFSHKIVPKSILKRWSRRAENGSVISTFNLSTNEYKELKIKEAYGEDLFYTNTIEKLLSDEVETILGDFAKKIFMFIKNGTKSEIHIDEVDKVRRALFLMNLRNPNFQRVQDLDVNSAMEILIRNATTPKFIKEPKFCIMINKTDLDFVLPASFTIGTLPIIDSINQFFPLSPRYGILLSDSPKYTSQSDMILMLEINDIEVLKDFNTGIIQIENKIGYYKEIIGNFEQLQTCIAEWQRQLPFISSNNNS